MLPEKVPTAIHRRLGSFFVWSLRHLGHGLLTVVTWKDALVSIIALLCLVFTGTRMFLALSEQQTLLHGLLANKWMILGGMILATLWSAFAEHEATTAIVLTSNSKTGKNADPQVAQMICTYEEQEPCFVPHHGGGGFYRIRVRNGSGVSTIKNAQGKLISVDGSMHGMLPKPLAWMHRKDVGQLDIPAGGAEYLDAFTDHLVPAGGGKLREMWFHLTGNGFSIQPRKTAVILNIELTGEGAPAKSIRVTCTPRNPLGMDVQVHQEE